MRVPLLPTLLSFLAILPLSADLSWEYIEKRQSEQGKTVEEAKKAVARVTRGEGSPAATAAYLALGKALNAHPEMAGFNAAEATARQMLKAAQASDDADRLASAQAEVARAARARFEKAASIPELARLIATWREAAGAGVTPANSPAVEKNTGAIEVGLDDLFE